MKDYPLNRQSQADERRRKLQITRDQLDGFEETHKALVSTGCPPDTHPAIYQAQLAALESQIDDLRGQLYQMAVDD